MCLYRFDADTQVVGNLFVQPPGNDALKHLRLAHGQARHERFAAGRYLGLVECTFCLVQHALDQS